MTLFEVVTAFTRPVAALTLVLQLPMCLSLDRPRSAAPDGVARGLKAEERRLN
jgi:hypothetical protein